MRNILYNLKFISALWLCLFFKKKFILFLKFQPAFEDHVNQIIVLPTISGQRSPNCDDPADCCIRPIMGTSQLHIRRVLPVFMTSNELFQIENEPFKMNQYDILLGSIPTLHTSYHQGATDSLWRRLLVF